MYLSKPQQVDKVNYKTVSTHTAGEKLDQRQTTQKFEFYFSPQRKKKRVFRRLQGRKDLPILSSFSSQRVFAQYFNETTNAKSLSNSTRTLVQLENMHWNVNCIGRIL